MPNMQGRRGIDMLQDKVQFVRSGGDIGLSKDEFPVSNIPRKRTILVLFENQCRRPNMLDNTASYLHTMATTKTNGVTHYIIPRSFNTVPVFFDRTKPNTMCFIGNPKDILKSCQSSSELMSKDQCGLRTKLVVELSNKAHPGGFLHVYGEWPDMGIPKELEHGIIGPKKNGLSGYMLSCPRTEGQELRWDGKFETISRHRFTLCLENAAFPGHVTEKIFQSISCGSVPVYIGAPDIEEYVPLNCFIDGRGMGTDDIFNKINRTTTDEVEQTRRNMLSWLIPNDNPFSSLAFAKKLLDIVEKYQ